jgi:capsular polysaccharide biosynthesis protein
MIRIVVLRMLESYFRHRWLYLLPLALMILPAIGTIALAPQQYVAQGTMFVENQSLLASLTNAQSDFSWWTSPSQQVVNDFNELLQTDAFARSAIQRTSLEPRMAQGPAVVQETLVYYRESLMVWVAGNKLVGFRAATEDPQLSQQIVASAMDSYVLWKINAEYQESVGAQNFFANLIRPYEEEVQQARDELTMYLATYPEPIRGDRPVEEQVELERLRSAVDEASRRLDDARAKEENARLALSKAETVARQTYQLIDAPEVPSTPTIVLRQLALRAAVFPVFGLIVTIMGIVGAVLLDRSLSFPVDIQQSLSLPVLAIVPDDHGVQAQAVAMAAVAPLPAAPMTSNVALAPVASTNDNAS